MNHQFCFSRKELLVFITLCFISFQSVCQQVSRKSGESASQFIGRLKPAGTILAHPEVETSSLIQNTPAIIALYGYPTDKADSLSFTKIMGHVYIQTQTGSYRDIQFGPIDEDGGSPEVLSVFFANANKDKVSELIVLTKYPQRHYDYTGDLYETHIYTLTTKNNQLTYLEKLSEKFGGCECEYKDGRKERAIYKNAKDIKTRLKKMGY
ncbi:MAG: hypothetical protein EOO88_42590 [Pedobacter sp.]|nr:MAG: hypothetical protein EOO88_42590 [Pedobacter sp.]